MSTSLPLLDAHTTALVAMLSAAGVRTGDGVKPTGAGWQGAEGSSQFNAYCIVYQLPFRLTGTVARPSDDLTGVWQVTSISADRKGAQSVADKARTVLLDGTMTVPQRRVEVIRWDGGGAVQRDDTTTPVLFYATDRFVVRSFPK